MLTALFSFFFFVLPIVGWWKIFEKANISGLACLPILNWFGTLKLLGRSYLWILAFIFFLPVTHFVTSVMVAWRFGKSTLFGLGIAFLPGLFVPLLGFSDARYLGRDGR